MEKNIDILESKIKQEILEILLFDHTTEKNIFWATSDYEELGYGYKYNDPITYEVIKTNDIIVPRVKKTEHQRTLRSRNMAEVFTPSWVCNKQNNLIDEEWFGRKNVFNEELIAINGKPIWRSNSEKIRFDGQKTWEDYVSEIRMEITCGEAPYLVSRYDATSGDYIPVEERIGLLDRKLRVVSENVDSVISWVKYALIAYKNIYAFEWQGDNLLLARESLLQSFVDHYVAKFPEKMPTTNQINSVATVISWNVWQMDGLKGVVPNSCYDKKCIIMDWQTNKPVKFVDLINGK